MRGKTPKELPFTEWVMESCRDYFALRARGGELLSFADQKLIDIYRERAVERLTMDYEVYRSRQISWIRANLDGLHRHWPSLHAEEIFDELEDLMNREEASV